MLDRPGTVYSVEGGYCKEPYRVLTVCLRSPDLGTPGLRRVTLGVCYFGYTPDWGVGLDRRL